jgi:hypothetical protein
MKDWILAYFKSGRGDDKPWNSHGLFGYCRPDGSLFRRRCAHLLPATARAGLSLHSERTESGQVVITESGPFCFECRIDEEAHDHHSLHLGNLCGYVGYDNRRSVRVGASWVD